MLAEFQKFLKDESGVGIVEFLVITGVLLAVAVAILTPVGGRLLDIGGQIIGWLDEVIDWITGVSPL